MQEGVSKVVFTPKSPKGDFAKRGNKRQSKSPLQGGGGKMMNLFTFDAPSYDNCTIVVISFRQNLRL